MIGTGDSIEKRDPHTGNWARCLLAAVAFSIVAMMPSAAAAVRFTEPILVQVTRNTMGEVEDPRLRSERPYAITFSSDGDVLGPGSSPGHREVYHWELGEPAILPAPQGIVRVTNSATGESYSPARPTDTTQSNRPEFVAFVSTASLDPLVSNADGNAEIFIWIKATGEIRQITDTSAGVENIDAYASDSGRCIVFSSNGDLSDNDGSFDPVNNPGTPYKNPDASREVFLVQLDNSLVPEPGSWTQVSNGPAGTTSSRPVIGGYYYPRQCNVTAYMSDHPQVSDAQGGLQLFNFKRVSAEIRPLTAKEVMTPDNIPPTGDYFRPHISSASNFARGPHIVFHTGVDMWKNDEAERPNMNIWRYRVFHPRMTQYTDLRGTDGAGNLLHARNAVVSDGGRWIAFESNGDLLNHAKDVAPPYNADANWEIFRIRGRTKLQQITRTTGCENSDPSILDKGVSVAFRSTCELIPGLNPAGVAQVYLYLQLTGADFLSQAANCKVEQGCCSRANGCYPVVQGRIFPRVAPKNCETRKKGCD